MCSSRVVGRNGEGMGRFFKQTGGWAIDRRFFFWTSSLYGLVGSDALGISSGHGGNQVGIGELTDDGGRFLALLLVDQLVVALQGAHRLDLASVDGFLLELLAELELDGGVLEGRGGVEGVLVALLDQFDRRRDAVAELAEHHADTWGR